MCEITSCVSLSTLCVCVHVCEIREGQRVEVVFDASLSGRLQKN